LEGKSLDLGTDIYTSLKEIIDQSGEAILGTVVAVGGLPQESAGGKILFCRGKMAASFRLSNDLVASLELIHAEITLTKPQLIRHYLPLSDSTAWLDVYWEGIAPAPELIVFGGGHISLPLVQLGKMIGFHVTVVDDRPDFANKDRFPQADRVICLPFAQALEKIKIGLGTFITIVTRGHRHDQTCLRGVIDKSPAYIGMIGSRSRVKKMMHELASDGISQEAIDAVYAPIGLDIHADTPEEIAVSIIAQIISVRRGPETLNKDILKVITEPFFQNMKKVLVTIVRRRGSVPRGVGAKMLVLEDGRCFGSIGGGCVEAEVRSQALLAIHEGNPLLYHVDLTNDLAGEEGMACGGTIDAFIEPI